MLNFDKLLNVSSQFYNFRYILLSDFSLMLYVMRNESSIVKKLVAGNFYVLYEKYV